MTGKATRRGVIHGLAFAALVCLGTPANAQKSETSCADRIRAVFADIAARDLDTAGGPPLNAFLTLNAAAIADAEALDRKVADGAVRGPMHCVPVAVKDNFDTADMPVSVGSLSLAENRPPKDADLVARIRAAGGIIVGKTNMDEFAMGIRGLSGAGGRVGNAYNTSMTPGGSSSGSGVAVAAGFVPLALGSDNCGSLRIPAVYNGVVALRPSFGRFSTDGVFPIGFVNGVTGAIARDVPTLRQGLAALADDWRPEPASAMNGLRGMRIGVLRSFNGKDPWAPADKETRAKLEAAVALMRKQGAEIVDRVSINAFDTRLGVEFLKGFGTMVDRNFATYRAPYATWNELCGSGLIRPEWTAKECRAVAASSRRQERVAVRRIADNRARITAMMDRVKLDAILYPTDGRGGARSDTSPNISCFIAGSSGLPAGAVPMALDARGMPIGIEWLGRVQSDEMLVAIMAAFEAARGSLPAPKPIAGSERLSKFDIPRQNAIRHEIGLRAFRSRKKQELGDLEPMRFRTLTNAVVDEWARREP